MLKIKKKFNVDTLPPNLDEYKSTFITQGYITTDPEIRVQKEEELCTFTVKSNTIYRQEEVEIILTDNQYNDLLNKVKSNFIKKRRYYIPLEDNVALLDIYEGELDGLITVEVELKNKETWLSFLSPTWFGAEITKDINYKNKYLAFYGLT